jgi:hypothetical protein
VVDRKEVRKITKYTRAGQSEEPSAWFNLANSFHLAAQLLDGQIDRDSRPFALNAAYSLELILKANLAKQGVAIPAGNNGHDLKHLSLKADIGLNDYQMVTLELLTETLVWSGRYPAPKTDARWDEYHDKILEKHIVRRREGNSTQVFANGDTFPNWRNYIRIWDACVAKFEST